MAHNSNWSIIIRGQRTAQSSQYFSAFCLPHMYGTWLPLPEMAAVSTMVKLTSSGEIHKFLHFFVQIEVDLQHLLNRLVKYAFFLNTFAWIGFKIDLCAIARKWPLKRMSSLFQG